MNALDVLRLVVTLDEGSGTRDYLDEVLAHADGSEPRREREAEDLEDLLT